MNSARTSTLATLRGTIGRLEGEPDGLARVGLGHASVDAVLQGGLVRGALHEVFAEGGRHGAAATGFIAGLAHRLIGRRPLIWVQQDFAQRESGTLSMSGLNELGLDPRLLVTVRTKDAETALRAASDALARSGGTITHHHAVGRMHRPWYDRERPPLFAEVLRAAKRTLDPDGLLNPGVLVDPDDAR